MTKYTVEESGDFRRGAEGDKSIFMAPPARMVPELMSDLFGWMEQEKNTIHPLIPSWMTFQGRRPRMTNG